MFYEPKDGHGLPHEPLKAIVAPRPIGWISTLDAQGRRNLAPYSFCNMVQTRPALLAFGSDGLKHTAANAMATGEFVFNLATRPLFDAMNASCSAPTPLRMTAPMMSRGATTPGRRNARICAPAAVNTWIRS